MNLKINLETCTKAWVEKLLEFLWAYRITTKTFIGETPPFSLIYNIEVIVPIKFGLPSYKTSVENL